MLIRRSPLSQQAALAFCIRCVGDFLLGEEAVMSQADWAFLRRIVGPMEELSKYGDVIHPQSAL